MKLHPLQGHEAARGAVAGAFARDRLPQALLLHGRPGVGKQRFALWTGQLLLCGEPGPDGPCDSCQGCRLAARVEHPDLHWYFPLKRPSSRGSRERDDEALEDARTARIEELRSRPLQPTWSDEPQGLHLGTVRNLRRRVGSGPSMGRRQVFVIARAEELVAQESSPEAANALLKILEEPPASTWLILTSNEPGRLLPTIRSRTSAMHLPPLPQERVADFLERERGAEAKDAQRIARIAAGSIGLALGYLPEEGTDDAKEPRDGPLERLRKDAFRLLRDSVSPHAARQFMRALEYRPVGGRGLQELLVALEVWIRDLAAVAAGSPDQVLNRDAAEWLGDTVRDRRIHARDAARALAAVEEAREAAAGNANPQLVVAGLLLDLRQTLAPSSPRPSPTP
ncbi:MAG: ATP-binding protein [Acidobacteriota bacterium]